VGRGDVAPRGEGAVEDKREVGEALLDRAGEVGPRINW